MKNITDNTNQRKDKNMRKLIDIAASIADNGMTNHAADVCAGNNVPFDVALRVITKPKQRRTNNAKDYTLKSTV